MCHKQGLLGNEGDAPKTPPNARPKNILLREQQKHYEDNFNRPGAANQARTGTQEQQSIEVYQAQEDLTNKKRPNAPHKGGKPNRGRRKMQREMAKEQRRACNHDGTMLNATARFFLQDKYESELRSAKAKATKRKGADELRRGLEGGDKRLESIILLDQHLTSTIGDIFS